MQEKITVEELLKQYNKECVFIDKSYFSFLYSIVNYKKNDIELKECMKKYIELDQMEEYVNKKSHFVPYYLMETKDIKNIIIKLREDKIKRSAFFKTDITIDEMNEKNNDLKLKYFEKQNEHKSLEKIKVVK